MSTEKINLKTTFLLTTNSRMTEKSRMQRSGFNTMQDLATGINALSWKQQTLEIKNGRKKGYGDVKDMLTGAEKVINGIQLMDAKSNTLDLSDACLTQEEVGRLQFVYGKICKVNFYTETEAFILCEYAQEGSIKAACLVAKKEVFEKLYTEREIKGCSYLICGTVVRRQRMMPGKIKYNARTRRTYCSGEDKITYRNRLIHFEIIPVNRFGLNGESEEIMEYCNRLCQEGHVFLKKVHGTGKESIQIL